VFDFDQTISIVHMFHILFGQGCPSEPLQVAAIQDPSKVSTTDDPVAFCEALLGGSARVERLRHVLETLHKSNVELMICTFGHCDAVRELFVTLKMDHLFTRIFGNGVFKKNTDKNVNGEREFCKKYPLPPTSKMGVMAALRQELELSYDQTLFIDDDKNNILMCQGVCRTMYIPKREGLTEEMLQALEDLACAGTEDRVEWYDTNTMPGWWKDPSAPAQPGNGAASSSQTVTMTTHHTTDGQDDNTQTVTMKGGKGAP